MEKEVEKCTKLLTDSTIQLEKDSVLTELGSFQVRQTFRAAVAVHKYGSRDQPVQKVFRITFLDNRYSPSFLNASSYIQRVLGGLKLTPLSSDTITILSARAIHYSDLTA